MPIDSFDSKILDQLQHDASLSIAKIADRVGLSPTPCWRRIQRLEKEGFIERRVAVLNPEKLDLGLTVFVMIKTDKHNQAWLDRFQAVTQALDEIIEVNRLAGEYDYLLKVITRNNQSFDAFYKRLISRIELSNVTSCFTMEHVKRTHALPLSTGQ